MKTIILAEGYGARTVRPSVRLGKNFTTRSRIQSFKMKTEIKSSQIKASFFDLNHKFFNLMKNDSVSFEK
tara:strand:+ start:180 stop:389 length:210 start_codon:yes stop_codon:yes gene_type:complete